MIYSPCRLAKIIRQEVRFSNIVERLQGFKERQMKSHGFLFEKLIDEQNILSAIKFSSRRKRDRDDVCHVLENTETYIKKLQTLLIEKKYKVQTHKAVKIFDETSKKDRFIIQPKYVYEQIIHHAVIQVLQPIFMHGMYDFSCGSIPGRGGVYGKRYIEKYIQIHNDASIKYCLKLDIKHFYQTVDIDILKAKFKKIIRDERFLDVLYYIIDSNIAECDGELKNMGLPIGFYTSQWFANFYLQEFDHFIKEQLHIKCYVRYADDIVIFGSNKRQLHKDFLAIKEYLSTIHLEVKQNWQVFKFDYINKKGKRTGRPLDFMGFKFYRDKTTLRKHIFLSAIRTARRISKKEKITWFDACQIMSYTGWFKHTDTYKAFEKYITPCVNITQCKEVIKAKQKRIENKEKKRCSNLKNQKVLKNQSKLTTKAPPAESTSESIVQLSLFPIQPETKK